MQGKGKYIFSNGDEYEGDFYNDKLHGKGKMTFKNGNFYLYILSIKLFSLKNLLIFIFMEESNINLKRNKIFFQKHILKGKYYYTI